jgi:hypothetical protein
MIIEHQFYLQESAMGIEMWFKDDVRNILISANASSAATAEFASGPAMLTYRLGYQSALMAVALACGIPPDQVGIPQVNLERSATVTADSLRIEAGSRASVR